MIDLTEFLPKKAIALKFLVKILPFKNCRKLETFHMKFLKCFQKGEKGVFCGLKRSKLCPDSYRDM